LRVHENTVLSILEHFRISNCYYRVLVCLFSNTETNRVDAIRWRETDNIIFTQIILKLHLYCTVMICEIITNHLIITYPPTVFFKPSRWYLILRKRLKNICQHFRIIILIFCYGFSLNYSLGLYDILKPNMFEYLKHRKI